MSTSTSAWEYDRFRADDFATMQEAGLKGWEMVTVAGEWAYFKRPIGKPRDTSPLIRELASTHVANELNRIGIRTVDDLNAAEDLRGLRHVGAKGWEEIYALKGEEMPPPEPRHYHKPKRLWKDVSAEERNKSYEYISTRLVRKYAQKYLDRWVEPLCPAATLSYSGRYWLPCGQLIVHGVCSSHGPVEAMK